MKSFEAPPQFNPELPPQKQKAEQPPQLTPEQGGSNLSAKMKKTFKVAKEKIATIATFVREKYFGGLNQKDKDKDFDEFLSLDFQDQLRDNPPIEGVFSPETELARIKSLPKEQKREALTAFKEKLARQREAFAACRVFIERSIEFNHDVPREKLTALIEKFGGQYGFTDEQKQIAEGLVNNYYANRQKVLEVKQHFSDDTALVNELTDIEFGKNERFDVSVGPMTIDIDADGFNAGRIYEKADKPVIGFKYGGFASQSVGENPVYYIVINQDRQMRRALNDPTGEKTRKHEYEHQKNKLFRAVFESQFGVDTTKAPWGDDYCLEQDPEVKKVILEEFFGKKRADALEQAKDEITACLCDEDLPTVQRQLEQLFFSGEGAYDYLGQFRNSGVGDVLYQEIAQEILVQEYRVIIEKAVESYAKLVRKGGYSTQEATALLTDKPLQEWPKTIRRLLEQKEKD